VKSAPALRVVWYLALYGALNPYDDFAEFFAVYVHSFRLGKPYRVSLRKDGKEVASVDPCTNEARCKAKKELLDAYFLKL
jgi:hypothetical protein